MMLDLSELIIQWSHAFIEYLKESPGNVSAENNEINQLYVQHKIKVNMTVSEMGVMV
ncbi:MAG: hypothetical protein IPI60_05350 [Saprospiraceae bacterium]|nr:hypothetical protein [Saprospiraceae bacterium]